MNIDPHTFSDDQRKFLSQIVSDFGGPTMTGSVLQVFEQVVYMLKPDIDLARADNWDEDVWKDFEVCMAALQYWKVHQIAKD